MATIYIVDDGSVAKSPEVAFTTGTLDIVHKRQRGSGSAIAVQVNYDDALTCSAVNFYLSNDGVKWIDYTSDVTVKTPPAGGSERETGISFTDSGWNYFRVSLVHSAGTPNVQAFMGFVS